jgi:AhpD family alkylhydroperoxidase
MAFLKALMKGRLTVRQRESLALAVAQANACQYCLSANTASGKKAGLSEADIVKARSGQSDNALDNAVLTFAVKAVPERGQVSDEDIASAHAAEIDDSLMLETVANIALHTLTNYTNRLAGTEIDFPVVHVAA